MSHACSISLAEQPVSSALETYRNANDDGAFFLSLGRVKTWPMQTGTARLDKLPKWFDQLLWSAGIHHSF